MATPTITLLNYTSLTTADTSTGWFDTVTADTDIKVEGTASMSGILRASGEISYYDSGTAPVSAVGKTLRGWYNTTNVPYLTTLAGGGLMLEVFDGTATQTKNIAGSDTYAGGWINYIWDMNDYTTVTLANVRRWGIRQTMTVNGKNVINAWHDTIRYLDGYSMTGGTISDKVRLVDIELYDRGTVATTLRGYGIITATSGVYFCTGTVQFGTGATSHYFEMDGQILVFKNEMVRTGLYSLSGVGSGTNIVIKNSVIRSAGTTDSTRFIFDFDEANLATFSCIDNLINKAGICSFKTGQTVTGNTFDNCGQITPGGATMTDSTIKNYEGTVDTSALIWNVATDPDGKLDDSTFIKGLAATHAIQLGATAPAEVTLRGITFSGFNASHEQNDSAVLLADTGVNRSWVINAIACSGIVSVKKTRVGDSYTVVSNPVTVLINVKNSLGANIQGARVFIKASDGTPPGPFPFEEAVTISNSGATATVTHTDGSHAMATNDKVVISGASLEANNGVFSITVTGPATYTYIMGSSPGDGAVPGTITSTFVVINGETDIDGNISMSRVFSADQPIIGWARKHSTPPNYTPPNYKTGPIGGSVDSAAGLTANVQLVSDD